MIYRIDLTGVGAALSSLLVREGHGQDHGPLRRRRGRVLLGVLWRMLLMVMRGRRRMLIVMLLLLMVISILAEM